MIKVSFDKKIGKWTINRQSFNFGTCDCLNSAVTVAMYIGCCDPIESVSISLTSYPRSRKKANENLRVYRSYQDDLNQLDESYYKSIFSEEDILDEYNKQKFESIKESK